MRQFFLFSIATTLIFGSFLFWEQFSSMKEAIQQYVETGEFLTLEAKFTPDHLMEKHKKQLLIDDQHSYLEPVLKYYPCLLLEAKYSKSDRKTEESKILWSLIDGEIVLDTESWEMTSGFEDAIQTKATRNDYRIIYALSKSGGILSRERLQKELNLNIEILDSVIESAISKKLIIESGKEICLHIHKPHLIINPQTKIKQQLVTKPYKSGIEYLSKKYSAYQLEKASQAAFGPAFTIRQIRDVYLPVYQINILNPDDSILTTYWNALNGQRMMFKY